MALLQHAHSLQTCSYRNVHVHMMPAWQYSILLPRMQQRMQQWVLAVRSLCGRGVTAEACTTSVCVQLQLDYMVCNTVHLQSFFGCCSLLPLVCRHFCLLYAVRRRVR
jgi:hypothetical protein